MRTDARRGRRGEARNRAAEREVVHVEVHESKKESEREHSWQERERTRVQRERDEREREREHVRTGDVAQGVPLSGTRNALERAREPSDNLSLGTTVYIIFTYTRNKTSKYSSSY